jgi:hypothetical protein
MAGLVKGINVDVDVIQPLLQGLVRSSLSSTRSISLGAIKTIIQICYFISKAEGLEMTDVYADPEALKEASAEDARLAGIEKDNRCSAIKNMFERSVVDPPAACLDLKLGSDITFDAPLFW